MHHVYILRAVRQNKPGDFCCCQETTETQFLIDRQALTFDNTAAAALTRLRSRLYVQQTAVSVSFRSEINNADTPFLNSLVPRPSFAIFPVWRKMVWERDYFFKGCGIIIFVSGWPLVSEPDPSQCEGSGSETSWPRVDRWLSATHAT